MQISSLLLLLSAFLATTTGQTLTYDFPTTAIMHKWEYPQVCVKGAKWADLITTNFPEYRYDISSTDFRNGDMLDGRWSGRHAINIPDSFECKGGILFHRFSLTGNEYDLRLKATLADGETKLTVCALIGGHAGSWYNALPPLGFTRELVVFGKVPGHWYNQNYTLPYEDFHKVNTFCKDFDPANAIDESYFSEAEPLPQMLSYTFPEVGVQEIMSGICIKGAQFASATNSVIDYPEYKMSSRQFSVRTALWWDGFFWETNRNVGDGALPMEYGAWSAERQGWASGNACEGGLYLQPQRREQNSYWTDNGVNPVVQETLADQERLGTNRITVEVLPEDNESSVEICALVSAAEPTGNWNNLGDYGFTNYSDNDLMPNMFVYCKHVALKVTMKLKL